MDNLGDTAGMLRKACCCAADVLKMTIWQTPAGIVDEGGMVLGAWLNFGLSLEAPPANGLMHVSPMQSCGPAKLSPLSMLNSTQCSTKCINLYGLSLSLVDCSMAELMKKFKACITLYTVLFMGAYL